MRENFSSGRVPHGLIALSVGTDDILLFTAVVVRCPEFESFGEPHVLLFCCCCLLLSRCKDILSSDES